MNVSKQLYAVILNFIVDNNLPFTTIQQPTFRQMLNTVAGRVVSVPGNKAFMQYVRDQFNEMKRKLSDALKKQPYICVTCDVWSSRSQSYLGMTVHYLNENYEIESFVLAFRELKKKQTYDVLAEEIFKVFEDYDISVDKVTNIVTDGGSAFCKAFKIYGKGSDPLLEKREPIVFIEEDDDENDQAEMPFMQTEDGEHFYSNTLNFDGHSANSSDNHLDVDESSEESFDEETIELDDYISTENSESRPNGPTNELIEYIDEQANRLPDHRRCLAHQLNLIAGDFQRELPQKASKALITTYNKLQVLWVLPRKSSFAKTICKQVLNCQLTIPCETRWNSKFDAIQHVFVLKDKMNEYVDCLKDSIKNKSTSLLEKFDETDWIIVKAYLKTMEPIALSLDRLQGERNCGQGFVLPTLLSMRHKVLSLKGGNLLRDFQETMLKVLNRRFFNFFEISEKNRDLVVASMSTPRFKGSFIADEGEYDQARRMFLSECIKLSVSQDDSQPEAIGNDVIEEEDDFFMSFRQNRNSRRSSIEQNIESEVHRYLDDERKEFSILNEYPNIRRVFYKYNTTLCSSGVVERVFSQTKLIFTPQRSRLLPENFERILLLKHNRRLLTENK